MLLLIKVGGLIGALPTVVLVMLTALIGVAMFRVQGFNTLQRMQEKLAMGELPGMELIEGAMLLVGGALLLTPGFFTDAIGFICLIPISRKAVAGWVVKHSLLQPMMNSEDLFRGSGDPFSSQGRSNHNTYEGEFNRD
ncbi:MAG TPA: hypothetical protein DCZ03_04200 [Gammaproteobacteria bacterium]|nr:hypothetical protein [Gammaproteobacteria bacterium]